MELCENEQAPVEPGQTLGKLQVYVGDELRDTLPITAADGVERLGFGDVMGELMRKLLMAECR